MKILIAGDFCPQNRVCDYLSRNDFQYVLGGVKNIMNSVDYSIANLECPVTYKEYKPLAKSGPNLQCSENAVAALKWAGFDCVSMANNHIKDYGEEGIRDTLKACEKHNIDVVGAGIIIDEASKTLTVRINEKKLSIINCCEHEFSIASTTEAGCNPLNPIKQYYAIRKASQESDFVLVIVHGGNEHCPYPSQRMQETYRFLIDSGAHAVINHHQHCVNGFEVYNGAPIFYGLGNFCFDKNFGNNDGWYKGYFVVLEFEQDSECSFKIVPYCQCKEEPVVRILEGEEKEDFSLYIDNLNKIIQDPCLLQKKWEDWVKQSGNWILPAFEPYQDRITKALYNRKILPSTLKGERRYLFENVINCESHIDRLRYLFSQIENDIGFVSAKRI